MEATSLLKAKFWLAVSTCTCNKVVFCQSYMHVLYTIERHIVDVLVVFFYSSVGMPMSFVLTTFKKVLT